MTNSKKIRNYLFFLSGLFFMGLGISLVTKSNLGTSPISSVPYVLCKIFPITFGQCNFVLSLLFLLVQILILRKEFPKKQLLQVVVASFFGFFIDLGMAIFHFVNPTFYLARMTVFLIGCVVLALGIYLQIAANVLVNPGEGLVKTIAHKTSREFGTIKIIFDCTLMLIALAISLYIFRSVKGLGVGTIISAVLVGYFTKKIHLLFQRFNFASTL